MSESRWKSEAQFQAYCTREFDRVYPELRGRLILQYNNPPNKVMAGILVSMGMRRGVADQVFYSAENIVVWLEYKLKGKKQSEYQKAFELMVKSWGHHYYVIEEEPEIFFNIINLYNGK
jgi:hypothetical protein